MKRFGVFALLLVLSLMLFISCSSPEPTEPPTGSTEYTPTATPTENLEPIKIGCLLDLTGTIAPLGLEAKQGILTAMEQAGGELLGRPIEFIIEDSASDVNTSMDKVRKLVEVDKVRLVIGPIWGSAQEAMGGYADKVHVPILTIASSQNIEVMENEWTFLTAGTCESSAYGMGIYAAEVLGHKTATALGCDFVAGHEFVGGFAKGFEETGGEVIQYQWYPPGTTDFTSYLLAAEKADSLVVWWPGADNFAGFAQYTDLGIKMPIIQPEDGGITFDPAANPGLGDAIIGVYGTVMYSYLAETNGNEEFVALYTEKYGVPPGPAAGAAYVSTQVALEAIKNAGDDTSPETLRQVLLDISIDTINGQISFNKDRVAALTFPVMKVGDNIDLEIVAEYRVTAEKVGDELLVHLAD